MIDTSNASLLMIEPSANVSAEPVIDALTLRMAAALLKARAAHAAAPRGLFTSTRGEHTAASGATSDNVCWEVDTRTGSPETHSLAVHYLAWSRHEIPAAELAKLELLPLTFADPEDPKVLALINPRGFTPPAAPAKVSLQPMPGALPAHDEALTLDQLIDRIAAHIPLGYEPEIGGVRLSLRSLGAALGAAYGISSAIVDSALTDARRCAAAEDAKVS